MSQNDDSDLELSAIVDIVAAIVVIIVLLSVGVRMWYDSNNPPKECVMINGEEYCKVNIPGVPG